MGIEYKTTGNATWRTTPKDDLVETTDTVTLRLNPTATTYQWYMLGRPEQSDAGSPASIGPDFLPVDLGTAAEPTFVVDTDSEATDVLNSGTYVIKCIANPGTASEAVHRIALARLPSEGGLVYSPRNSAYEAFRVAGHKEIADDGGGDKIDDWSYALERLAIATMQLRDMRCGIQATATSPQAISWTRPFISTAYVPVVIAKQTTPTGAFQITNIVNNTTTQFTVTFVANATTIDLYWHAILVKDS